MIEQFEKTGKDALAALKKVTDVAELEAFRIKYLARKGQITKMLSQIGKFPPQQKPKAGQLANKIKKEVTEAFEQLKQTLLQSQQKTGDFRYLQKSTGLRCRGLIRPGKSGIDCAE